jgi:hypothetical protein
MVGDPSDLQNSRFFSVIDGNSIAETGSIWTASATTHSFELEDFPETSQRPAIGGLRYRRFSLRGDLFRRGGDFGLAVSARGKPVSRKCSSAARRFGCRYPAIKPSSAPDREAQEASRDVAFVETVTGRVVAFASGAPTLLGPLDVITDRTRVDVLANSELRLCPTASSLSLLLAPGSRSKCREMAALLIAISSSGRRMYAPSGYGGVGKGLLIGAAAPISSVVLHPPRSQGGLI